MCSGLKPAEEVTFQVLKFRFSYCVSDSDFQLCCLFICVSFKSTSNREKIVHLFSAEICVY